jgi:glycerol-3-phosphate dehydrogenase
MCAMSAFPLIRAPAPFKERTFDVLVVGGGIYGAWTAYDAALRGLSVALIERHDWAAGTSSASSKLIHGGLRYLEHYDFGLVRDALVERRRLHRLAPHLVRPLGFVMPVWKGPRASMLMLSAGLTLYDFLGGRGQPVGWHKRFSAKALLRHFPFVDPERLLGGFWYGDCQEDDARLTLAVVAAAQQAGAIVANRLEAEALLEDGDAVVGARVRDRLADERFDVRARVVVNAAGPWAPQLPGAAAPRVRRVKGIHIVVPAIPDCDQAFLLTAQDGRVFFVLPWYGRTLIGTTEQEVTDPDQAHATDEEVRYLLAGVRNGLPGVPWTEADVLARFAGVRTLQAEDAENLAAVTREFTVLEPRRGVVMPLGGKFTTARCDAVEIVDRVQQALGKPRTPSLTARQPLPGAPPPDEPFERWQAAMIPLLKQRGVDAACAAALTLRHGSRIGRIAELIHEEPRWAERLSPTTTLVVAELVMAVRDEMALSLNDVIRRRVPLLLLDRVDGLRIKELSLLVAPHLGRDSADIAGEFHAETARNPAHST